MTLKDEIHGIVDALPESELLEVRRFLRYLQLTSTDRVLRVFLDAPEDDEEETSDEAAAVSRAWDEYRGGEARPWSAIASELPDD